MKTTKKIIAVSGGFYFFGDEAIAPEGYYKLQNVAMFGGFEGGKGLPGVARGDDKAVVTLDRFASDQEAIIPIENVLAIFDSIDLYTFKGTKLR